MKRGRLVPVLLVSGAFLTAAVLPAQTPQLSMEGYPAPGAPAVVTVLSPGAAPEKALRYVIPANLKSRMNMTMSMAMVMDMGGQSMPMDLPTMKMGIDIVVTSVTPDGDISYDLAFTGLNVEGGPGANPAVVAAMQSAAAGITSMKGSATVSARGVTRSVRLDISDPTMKEMMSQMTSSFENVSMPLPEEPVGVGARWEVRQALSMGQTIFQKAEYELISIEGSTLSLKVKMEQTAPPQSVSNPAFPAGTEVRLEKLSGSGTGTMKIQLDSLVPTSELESTTSSVMTMSVGGQPQSITSDIKLKLTIAPGK